MALKSASHERRSYEELHHELQALTFELNYERSVRAVECVAKDESIRKLRFQLLLLEDENDEMNEQLANEEARVDDLERSVIDALSQLDQSEMEAQRLADELRMKGRDFDTLRAEYSSMQHVSADSAKLLTEKLSLTREISTMKPELDHLRAQCESHKGLLAEKLSLQRQVSTLQVELENEKRSVQKLRSRGLQDEEQDMELKSENEKLRKDLNKSKRECEKNERAADEARSELEKERDTSRRATVKAAANSSDTANDNERLEMLREEVAKEKRERVKAEKAKKQAQLEFEGKQTAHEAKLEAFREKVRSTKEKIKEKDAEIERLKSQIEAKPVVQERAGKSTKNPRKRAAPPTNPDATIGTPGDIPAKRSKKGSSMLGDKSTFSITPFLNRATSMAPDTPDSEHNGGDEPEENKNELQDTPTAPPKPKAKGNPRAKPLADSRSKTNVDTAAGRKKRAVPTLERVAEEGNEVSEGKENVEKEPVAAKEDARKQKLIPKLKPTMPPPRKSLAMISAFNEEPAPEKRKKRKLLGGGLGKTLFDEEDNAAPAKPIPGKGIFAGRALGKLGSFSKGGPIKGGFMMTTDDGFQFSPLKKDKRATAKA